MTADGIQTKLSVLRDNLDKLGQIPQSSFEEFSSDFRNLDSALHRLQTSVQVLVDLASYIAAKRGLGAPTSSVDALRRLESGGLLPAGSVDRFAPVIGFRNRVVHLYDRIDSKIVYGILTKDRADLEDLARLLVEALEKS